MQRYFAKEKNNNLISLTLSDEHHIKDVMRNKINDNIEVVFANKTYLCKINKLSPLEIIIEKEIIENPEMNLELTVAIALVNEQKFDLILQKLTELGVSKIIPIKTERSIIKLDNQKETKKIERWQTICKEASEQSHRNKIPIVENIIQLKELKNEQSSLKLICSLNEHSKPLKNYLNNDISSILFTIGPEGGFTKDEEIFLENYDFKSVSLGKRVLRVETAAIYVASIINYIYEG